MSVLDHEKSRESKASENVWMTDDTISTGSWCYTSSLKIKPAHKVVHALVDTVAKNGVVLLNIHQGRIVVQVPALPQAERGGQFAYCFKLQGFELDTAQSQYTP